MNLRYPLEEAALPPGTSLLKYARITVCGSKNRLGIWVSFEVDRPQDVIARKKNRGKRLTLEGHPRTVQSE